MTIDLAYYSSTQPDSLASSMTNTVTSVVLVDGSTFPDPALNSGKQYTVILGYGTDREEVCTVTAKPTATTLTVLRGQDGTPATAKNVGDIVVHGVSARDFNAAAGHYNDTTSVHGIADTSQLAKTGDAPAAHGASHSYGGSDPVTTAYLGEVRMFGMTTLPAGWHLCDGSAHGSSALQAVIGSPNTPNLKDKFVRASGTGALGATGGADSVTLTAAQSGLVGHTHTASSAGETQEHTHTVDPPATQSGGHNVDHSHSGSTGSVNRNASHGHAIREGITTGDSDYWVDTADREGSSDIVRQNIVVATDTNHEHAFATGGASIDHSHAVNIAAFASAGRSAVHTHAVTVVDAAAATATASHENRPAFYTLTFAMFKGA